MFVYRQVGGTSLCFIAAHLAAHTDHVQRRNEDVAEILAGTKVICEEGKGCDLVASLKLTAKAPKNGWLEYKPFLLGSRAIFRGDVC